MGYQRKIRFSNDDTLQAIKEKIGKELIRIERAFAEIEQPVATGIGTTQSGGGGGGATQLILGTVDGAITIPVGTILFDSDDGFVVTLVSPSVGRIDLNLPPPEVTLPLPIPTQIGQVLYARTVSAFTPETPLTGLGGWMVNDDGLLLIV